MGYNSRVAKKVSQQVRRNAAAITEVVVESYRREINTMSWRDRVKHAWKVLRARV